MRSIPYEHFHPDEKPFVDKAAEWVEDAAVRKQTKRTDFLDPRQAFIVETLANREDGASVRTDGGYEGAERRRAIVAPDFLDPAYEPIGIVVLAVTSDDERIRELDHGDYLGAMLGLGVKRDKIGDIHVHEWGSHLLVAEEMAPFFSLHLSQVGRVRVFTDILPLDRLQGASQAIEELFCTVASLRLDGVVSEATRLSRAKAAAPIQAGRCKVNWKVEEDPSRQLKEGDVISLQGFGRYKILSVDGVSKKGRIRLKIGKFA
ncbi:RNA-binding protein [Paenibacillus sp.]|uniref:YlmH family RNA-binding protein n=1 Tax=Paenibacillus sp. TaxID=58172 RepID=UPI002D363665|nr:YlmH/Sll1252 family protein [Paenibacillus sp.]HZG55170.1 YlmH/Sll1252 family protein [Paenibacillus sp.]